MKKLIYSTLTIASVVVLASCSNTSNTATKIGEDKAKEIALAHAGQNEADVTFIKASTDNEDGLKVYDVEFYVGTTEYDYEIDAYNGDVKSFDSDIESVTAAINTTSTESTSIDETRAKEIALTHAGQNEADVTFIKSKIDNEDGRKVYDVEFYVGNVEYDYEIDSATGDVVSFDSDIESYGANTTSNNESTTTSTDSTSIDETRAKEIALTHAGQNEADATFIKSKIDSEDGRKVYDVEFYVGNIEYDYEIDSATGDVVSFDSDIENYNSTTATTSGDGTVIDETSAKEIALTHAGLNESDVNFIKFEIDYEDGIQVYDIEFNVGRTEYNYELDAQTGDIREYDMDND
ncbi:MAG: PepSY domain-containing protein [Lachnospirales bacterium]